MQPLVDTHAVSSGERWQQHELSYLSCVISREFYQFLKFWSLYKLSHSSNREAPCGNVAGTGTVVHAPTSTHSLVLLRIHYKTTSY